MKGRGVIVTGGTGVLGRAVVRRLLEEGARVAIPYRSARGWEELRSAEGGTGALWGATADVASPSEASRFVDEAVGWLGRLDGVAALAGAYAGAGTLEASPEDEWASMQHANLEPVWAICRAALPHLLREGGSIVTVGSRLVETGGANAAAYAASKAAVHALTRALAEENRTRGVRVNCVVPGTIDTPANRVAMPAADRSRWTPPQRIAGVVAFLLSPESDPVTGGLVPVHGPGSR